MQVACLSMAWTLLSKEHMVDHTRYMWAHLLGLQVDDQLALLVAVSDVVEGPSALRRYIRSAWGVLAQKLLNTTLTGCAAE